MWSSGNLHTWAAEVLPVTIITIQSRLPLMALATQSLELEILRSARTLLSIGLASNEIGVRIDAAVLVGWCGLFPRERRRAGC
jgi:hypothetical protein